MSEMLANVKFDENENILELSVAALLGNLKDSATLLAIQEGLYDTVPEGWNLSKFLNFWNKLTRVAFNKILESGDIIMAGLGHFSNREFIMKGFRNAIQTYGMPDYKVRLNAVGWMEKGVLMESDLAELDALIEAKNAPTPIQNSVIEAMSADTTLNAFVENTETAENGDSGDNEPVREAIGEGGDIGVPEHIVENTGS